MKGEDVKELFELLKKWTLEGDIPSLVKASGKIGIFFGLGLHLGAILVIYLFVWGDFCK